MLAVGDVAEPLVAAIKERLPKITVGPGHEDGSEMGPLITREHRDRVQSYLTRADDDGAVVVVDGSPVTTAEGLRDGFFMGCSLIDNVEPGMAVATVVAVGDVADPLVAAINDRLPRVKVGPGSDPTAEMGPLVTKQHRDKVA